MPKDLDAMLAALADIDAHVERVAIDTQTGSDMNTLAYAIHNLIAVVHDIATEQASNDE
jgi:hypothetical protein